MSSSAAILADGYVTQYANLAGSALLVYDYLLNLDDEIEFIWKKSWSIGKVLFILSRYYSLLATAVVNNYVLFGGLTHSGIQYSKFQAWSGLITCMLVEAILQMRLYALYLLDRRILLLMSAGFMISSAGTASVLVLMWKGPHIHVQTELPFCLTTLPDYCYAVWIPRLTFDTFLCLLALIRGFQLTRDEYGGLNPVIPAGEHLMKVLISDCVGSYLMMFAVYLTFLTIWAKNPNLIETCFNLSVGIESIVGTRTILRIRKVIEIDDSVEASAAMVNDMLK
ncbi:hypothetical protein EV361DRAFT_900365 [Lentinula raphanica]|nr:hypothetical protein EV361DRAFT_900365 [Lentinula raphanica]